MLRSHESDFERLLGLLLAYLSPPSNLPGRLTQNIALSVRRRVHPDFGSVATLDAPIIHILSNKPTLNVRIFNKKLLPSHIQASYNHHQIIVIMSHSK